ncbi:MAG TPA: serine hydrolase domain-containing protein [Cyclobacteriaceae bacterium]
MKAVLKLLPLLFFSSLMLSSCQKQKEKEKASLSDQLDSLFATVPDFSGVALVADHGKPLYHKAFGYRNFETKDPMDTATIFELASVSKQFTAVIIMMLKEEGKLSYDDPLEKYIPNLPYPGITIRHLLNHTSGLPAYEGVMDAHWDKTKVAGNEDNIEYLITYHPEKLFEPGEKYKYSNTGYMLLGSIIEKVSGKDFIEFINERIFTPVQMTNTAIRTKEEKVALPNMAWGHLYVKEKQRYVRADSFPEFNYSIWLGNRKGPGRISSTSSDLLKWDRALYTADLVKKETLLEAFTPPALKNDSITYYGFGWIMGSDSSLGKFAQHGGDNPGYKTKIIRYIDADKTIIVLCNNYPDNFDEFINQMMNIVSENKKE